ncbi:MAG: FAD-binding domain-containing protein [Pseudorhodobacter sp.]
MPTATRPPSPDARFAPTRDAGLARLAEFLPQAGADYARLRNFDLPGHPHVSRLSPWLRHRLLTEAELLEAAWAAHGPASEKFRQEVLWRSYWKGWLELRPPVWIAYRQGLDRALDRIATEEGLRQVWESACAGRTGIDGFDQWARELAATGWLHNHARMWFASIWIFTLRLPWQLGADFFLRHLLDGDAASNTLSWRWVAGLQTAGKTYLATRFNIARFTEGRFDPDGLAEVAIPLPPDPVPPMGTLPLPRPFDTDPDLPTGLLLHEDDLSPGAADLVALPRAIAGFACPQARSPLAVAPMVRTFTQDAVARRLAALPPGAGAEILPATDPAEALLDWARRHGLRRIVTAHAPVGATADALALAEKKLGMEEITLHRVITPYDADLWPRATHGFFRFHESVRGIKSGSS